MLQDPGDGQFGTKYSRGLWGVSNYEGPQLNATLKVFENDWIHV